MTNLLKDLPNGNDFFNVKETDLGKLNRLRQVHGPIDWTSIEIDKADPVVDFPDLTNVYISRLCFEDGTEIDEDLILFIEEDYEQLKAFDLKMEWAR